MTTPAINPFLEDDSDLEGERLQLRWLPVERIPLLLWAENPKSHDIGLTWQSIVENGFVDPAKWDINLKNMGGTQGALVYGNGRCEAVHHGWTQFKSGLWKGDIPRGINVDKAGNWYIQVKFGIDASSEARAIAFGIDHNIITISGGDFGIDGIMALFDEKTLAETWQKAARLGASPLSLDGQDLTALLEFLDEPDFDFEGDEDSGVKTGINGGDVSSEPPDSAIRMVQLFLNTSSIGEFSELARKLQAVYEVETLTDTVMEALRREASQLISD